MGKKMNKGIWSLLKPVGREMLLAVFLSAAGILSAIAGLALLSFALSELLAGVPLVIFGAEMNLVNSGLFLTLLVTVAFTARLASFTVSHLGAFKLEQILRIELSTHLAKVPLGYVISTGSGRLKKVIQNDVRELHAFVADSIPMLAKCAVAPVASLAVLFWADYRLALVGICVLLSGALIMSFAMKDDGNYRELYESSQADINQAVIEFAQAMPVLRTFDDGTHSFQRYLRALERYRKNLHNWLSATTLPSKLGIIMLSPLPTLLAVFSIGIYLLQTDDLQLSSFILSLFLCTMMADAFLPLMWLSNFIKKSQASAIRIYEVLDIQPLPVAQQGKIPENTGVVFDEVGFAYACHSSNKSGNKVLDDVSFAALPNTVTALVGPSGAGKSTVVKLVSRFWDVSEGAIEIGGVNIKDMTSDVLMNHVSFVFQDTFLFHDSIFNNIKMANPSATDEQVIEAAKAARIHDYIQSLPQGYQARVGDRGANLSGGQKQRITIARAILRDSPVIVLDEATSFADPENEEAIIAALANLIKDKTVIVIAHRLSTVKDADQILVFDKGQIVERGRHQQLLENRGIYHTLWKSYEQAGSWRLNMQSENEKTPEKAEEAPA